MYRAAKDIRMINRAETELIFNMKYKAYKHQRRLAEMKNRELLQQELTRSYCDKRWLRLTGASRDEVMDSVWVFAAAADDLIERADENGRIGSADILEVWSRTAGAFFDRTDSGEPDEGWLMHVYAWLRNKLFPHLEAPADSEKYELKRLSLLRFMRGVYEYERKCCRFDPTRDITLLPDGEITDNGFMREYLKMKKLVDEFFVYEFMRIGAEITPFNTLGHISGVHYTAMYVARQLHRSGIPVDLGLLSAAAASHDIGKYGCRKHEERRVPYLHYYYTDRCLAQFGLTRVAHIAANHSTWDLELDNLSVESLLLIYADFRTKSTRDAGREIIHFYTLDEAFEVILNKLDNVDEAKRRRYERVYRKLRDFEDYMTEHGVCTVIEDLAESYPPEYGGEIIHVKREIAFLPGDEVVRQLSYRAIDHNIRVMSRFGDDRQFGSLLESARSEPDSKNVRTYIKILKRYSTYMTDGQKGMTLRFLYEMLAHHESDIREQAADAMGYIVARYRKEYKKELPADIPAPDDNVSNLSMFGQYIELLLNPDHKYTEIHRKWISDCTDFFVRSVVDNCRVSCRHKYLDILSDYFSLDNCDEEKLIVLMITALSIDREKRSPEFSEAVREFCSKAGGRFGKGSDLLTLEVGRAYDILDSREYEAEKRKFLGIGEDMLADEQLSSLFLDDLKLHIPWAVKAANISVLKQTASCHSGHGTLMQIATHFSNMIKVSETVTVRKAAGEALLEIVKKMSPDQINELVIELFNGLEIEDYQFSGYIPEYLGVVLLYLPPEELDETIGEFERLFNSGSERTAAAALDTVAVLIENYGAYGFEENISSRITRRDRMLGLLMKGCAYYKKSIAREAVRTTSEHVFANRSLSPDEKAEMAAVCFKRMLTFLPDASGADELDFYNNASALGHIYSFISEYRTENGEMEVRPERPAAFFPGTFDPFSLGHKAIATTIRNMGFDVYLAIDEFSWSKKTLPHMVRRNILAMSAADEEGLYIFPDDISVNIANPADLGHLRALFGGRELYIAVGSDVVMNASAYKVKPQDNSIHSFNHIIFAREAGKTDADGEGFPVTADVLQLELGKYYEDISSTRIRENVDLGRDVSSLVDPVVQNYIYDMNLYVREPADKYVMQARELNIRAYEPGELTSPDFFRSVIPERKGISEKFIKYLSGADLRKVIIETADHRLSAVACARRLKTSDLLDEFGDIEVASFIRSHSGGEIAVIGAFYIPGGEKVSNIRQILLTELLTALVAKDYTYAVFHPVCGMAEDRYAVPTMVNQGFINIASGDHEPVYAVDMRNPIALFRDADTVVKAPFNKDPVVQRAFDKAHNNLLRTFREIYPGKLLLSFNTSAVYSKIMDLVVEENGVSTTPDPERKRGPYMAVPFGKALAEIAVPNTVTKAMRTEKYFRNDLMGFDVRESRGYQTLDDQARTIKSFARPVILIDDLLHSGQRLNKIDPILRRHDVEVRKIIVGLLTGRAFDSMRLAGREVCGAYYIPSISMWLNERDCYPFIGGDSIDNPENDSDISRGTSEYISDGAATAGWCGMKRRPDAPAKEGNASINLILPYTGFSFIGGGDPKSIYKYSITCLENTVDILHVLEQQYQKTFEKKLTIRRLGAVITNPRRPILGFGLQYDDHIAPSVYVENELRRTQRMFLFKTK